MRPDPTHLQVEVCRAMPDAATRIRVVVERGGTVGEAVEHSGLVGDGALDRATLSFAIFGRRVSPDAVLHDGDRIELLRPLIVDPKEARRRRAQKKSGASMPPCVAPERD